jgi:hypothetical protein
VADKPPLVIAVEAALRGPARWVRYAPGAKPVAGDPVVDVADDVFAMPPLVAAVEAALDTTVDTLRYLPSLTAFPSAAPTSVVAVSHQTPFDDEAMLAAAEAAVQDAILWLRYQPNGDEVGAVSLSAR